MRTKLGLAGVAVGAGVILLAAGIATAAPLGATDTTLRLDKVTVDGRGHDADATWSFSKQGGSATWTLGINQSTYSWTMPESVPATGAKVALTVTAKAGQGSRFAPAMSVSGTPVKEGTVTASTLAESGQSTTDSRTARSTRTRMSPRSTRGSPARAPSTARSRRSVEPASGRHEPAVPATPVARSTRCASSASSRT